MSSAAELDAPAQERKEERRPWLTAVEFLAQVEAYRRAKELERFKPRPLPGQPAAVRTYRLNPLLVYVRRRQERKAVEGLL